MAPATCAYHFKVSLGYINLPQKTRQRQASSPPSPPRDRFSWCSPSYPVTPSVDQAGLNSRYTCLYLLRAGIKGVPPPLPGFLFLKTGSYYITLPGLEPAIYSTLAKNSETCQPVCAASLAVGLGTTHISGPDIAKRSPYCKG